MSTVALPTAAALQAPSPAVANAATRSGRLRVLAIADAAPDTLTHGGHLRTHHLLRSLGMSADVTCVAARGDAHAPTSVWRIVGSNSAAAPPASVRPGEARDLAWQLDRRDAGLVAYLRNAAAEHDIVLLCGAAAGAYAFDTPLPAVWDLVDDQSLAFRRLAFRGSPLEFGRSLWRAAAWQRFERRVAARCRATVVVSSAETGFRCRAIRSIDVVPNGVDTDYFAPACDADPPREPRLVFFGTMRFRPNADAATHFARRVWPRLHRIFAALSFDIVGANPTPEVRALARCDGVRVLGRVDDLRPMVRSATAVVAPMRIGGGIKNKILEAWAMGTPVIATRRALDGFGGEAKRHVLLARHRRDWTRHVGRLLGDAAFGAVLADDARAYVLRRFTWRRAAQDMQSVLEQAVRS